jgi:hypothetical protein
LKYTTPTVAPLFTAGETITGAGLGVGYVAADLGDKVICYSFNGTTFVDGEVLTGGTSGKKAIANGIQVNEDILVPMTATSDTFNIDAVANRLYCIPIHGSMLTDGNDCVELNIADADTTLYAAWVVLSEPRFISDTPETAIYD